ncbi:MAG: ATP-dependent Clp protease proteolytic subunit [Patescibacteria group bacterium]
MVAKKDKKLSSDENDKETESNVYLDKNSRLISITGAINWQLADQFFNVLTGFELLPSRKPLTIYINSEGGGIYDMLKIYDHIRNSPLPIVTIVAGYALSAGFIVFLAGDLRKMFPNAFLGFHEPTLYFTGKGSEGPAESEESALHQNCLLGAMVRIVKNSSNMPEKMIRKYFRVLTRIDALTALKFGLAHQIIEPPKKILPKSWQKILKPS